MAKGRGADRPDSGPIRPEDELFCQEVAKGLPAGPAYKKTIAGKETKMETCYDKGADLMQRAEIRTRIAELRQANANANESIMGVTRETLCRWLISIIWLPAGDLDAEHALTSRIRQNEFGKQFEMPSKIEAARLLAEISGWKTSTVNNILATSPAVDAAIAKLFAKNPKR